MSENYIQYAEGYNKNNIDFTDIEKAIIEIQETDDEHGAFWVSVITDDENVIETDKELNLAIVFDGNQSNYKAKDWLEVKEFYKLLLAENFNEKKQKNKITIAQYRFGEMRGISAKLNFSPF